LPLLLRLELTSESESSKSIKGFLAVKKRKTILIIEDVAEVRMMLAMVLEQSYKVVLVASSGEEGLRLFQEQKVSLVITDLSMPGMDGLQVMLELRAINPKVKIIAHSGLIAQPIISQMAISAGADACIAKPVNITLLENIVAELLRK
jgi:CheY-like chemotaxis protein